MKHVMKVHWMITTRTILLNGLYHVVDSFEAAHHECQGVMSERESAIVVIKTTTM